jgi:peptidoglycan/xylan/chitin deacetylase (PgdA/CDA1 family)
VGLDQSGNFINGTQVNAVAALPPNQKLALTNDPSVSSIQINGQLSQYFNSTGHSLSGPLLHYYQQSGGQSRHGAPLTEILAVQGHYWQFFQNSVFEFDPRYIGTNKEVKLVPLGSMLAAHSDFPTVTPFVNTSNRWYFPASGHSLSNGFLNFWLNNGQLTTLGVPLSEEIQTQSAAGQAITVQYFEYARLEYHENPSDPSQSIQFTMLGQQKASQVLPPAQLSPVSMELLTTADRSVRIPSLMFHYVRLVDAQKDPLGFGLSVTPDNFVKYLDWLQTNGFHTVTVSQIYDYLRYGIALPSKPINLRFDDGHIDQWFAYQEMHKRGMTATFFVITRRLELTPQQWQQIDQDGFEVAAHTRTHPDLKGAPDLEAEITGSKTDLEAILGHPVRSFAYPYGSYGPTILKITKSSGFEVAVSTNGGVTWNLNKEFVEPTLSVTGRDDLSTFASKAEMKIGGLDDSSSSSSNTTPTTTKPVQPAKVTTKPSTKATAKPTSKSSK